MNFQITNIEGICERKQQELLDKYFGDLTYEASIAQPETIGEYTKNLPLKIEEEYRSFLEELWPQYAPEDMKGQPLVLEEQRLRHQMTEDDREICASISSKKSPATTSATKPSKLNDYHSSAQLSYLADFYLIIH